MDRETTSNNIPEPGSDRKTWQTPRLTIMPVLDVTKSGAFPKPPHEDSFYRPS